MKRQTLWRMLLTAAFLALMPWVAQAEIDPATAQKLLASDGATDDKFGFSVSVDGDTAVIGAPGVYNSSEPELTLGSVYVFTRLCSDSHPYCTWVQQQQLFADDGDTGDGFGVDVSVSGDTIVVGAPFDDTDNLDAGSAYIFTRSGSGEWTQQQKLADRERRSVFGFSVAVDGDTLVIGARQNSQHGLYAGAAYVYTRLSNGVWGEPKKLMADESPTQDGREARFGASVDIDGDTIVIGAYLYDNGDLSSDSGAAYVFTRSSSLSNDWDKHKLTAGDAGDQFGRSVSVSGDTVVIGSVQKDSGKGAAYVFTRSSSFSNDWDKHKQKLTADDGADSDYFGISVAVQGDTAVIGAYGDDDKGDASGSAYIFTRTDSGWSQQQKLTAPDDGLSDYLGRAVDLSGDAIFVTAFNDDENGSGAGAAWAFSLVRLALRKALAAVNKIDPSVFSNPNKQNALTNQINATIALIDQGTPASYAEVLDKLRNSIIHKTDGCAASGAPDNNDWILDCTNQAKVYPLLQQTMVCVQRL